MAQARAERCLRDSQIKTRRPNLQLSVQCVARIACLPVKPPAMSFPHHLYDLQHQPSVASPAQRRFAPSALEPSAGGGLMNVAIGPLLQCLEAASLGMPFEVRACADGLDRTH